MTVQDLIDELQKIKDKELPIRVIQDGSEPEENFWVGNIEVSDKGDSGYQLYGEVRLIGFE